eukprot:3924975-Pyramimonas_sp.AAC.1
MSVQEQLAHVECQEKKEGILFHIYMRNMSTWGPSAKLLRKRPYDAVITQETHMDKTESNDVLVEFDKAGYTSMVCPAGAGSS